MGFFHFQMVSLADPYQIASQGKGLALLHRAACSDTPQLCVMLMILAFVVLK